MALQTRELATFPGGSISCIFDDTNGGISQLSWIVTLPGTVEVIINNPPKPVIDKVIVNPESGSLAVNPNQYAFTFITKNGANDWGAPPSLEVRWSSN